MILASGARGPGFNLGWAVSVLSLKNLFQFEARFVTASIFYPVRLRLIFNRKKTFSVTGNRTCTTTVKTAFDAVPVRLISNFCTGEKKLL